MGLSFIYAMKRRPVALILLVALAWCAGARAQEAVKKEEERGFAVISVGRPDNELVAQVVDHLRSSFGAPVRALPYRGTIKGSAEKEADEARAERDKKLAVIEKEHAKTVAKLTRTQRDKLEELREDPDEVNNFLLRVGKEILSFTKSGVLIKSFQFHCFGSVVAKSCRSPSSHHWHSSLHIV